MWTPTAISPLGPVYVAIADALARDVAAGVLRPGERLPTHRALARALGVNVVTITRAYQDAARRGLVEGEVGRGTFVRERGETVLPVMPLEGEPSNGGEVDFHFNCPFGDPSLLAIEGSLAALARAPESARLLETGYEPRGLERHRAAGAAWLARDGAAADPERVLVASGVQHAMTVACASLCEPGETLCVEELTYPGVKATAALLHLKLAPLACDAHGLDPDAFELACKKGLARALYVQPTLQNPTATVMPAERRAAIAAIARRFGVPVIEDATAGYLLPDAPAPIAALAPELTWLCAGTSKPIAAGLRVAFVLVPARDVARAAATLAATAWMTSPLLAELAARWIEDGSADRMVAWKRAEARARRAAFDRRLAALATPSHPAASHVWAHLPAPWRATDFAAAARRAGVAVTPAEHFVVGRAGAPHAVRLALGRPASRADVERGLDALATALRGAPAPATLV